MEFDFLWVYLAIFLMIPLSRVIQRLLSKRSQQNSAGQVVEEQYRNVPTMHQVKPDTESKPKTKNMLVLGALNRGLKTFENIQKDTGLDNRDLDTVLGTLEEKGLLTVHQKEGITGIKIELFLTDRGFREYFS